MKENIKIELLDLDNYKNTGEYQQCIIYLGDKELPFSIKKYHNLYADKQDQKWKMNLRINSANWSLVNILHPKIDEDLNKIIKYCVDIYKKSLIMEQKRIADELELL